MPAMHVTMSMRPARASKTIGSAVQGESPLNALTTPQTLKGMPLTG